MKKRTLDEAKPYGPPKHFGCTSLRLQGKEESGITKFWMGMSYFLPGGGAEWDYEDSPTEKIYYVMSGEMTVTSKDGEITLKANDSLYIPPFEGRSMLNKTNMTCTVLVCISTPDAAK